MTTQQDREAIVRATFDEIMNRGQLDKADEYFAEDFVEHAVTGDIVGREAFKQYITAWFDAFPDRHTEVQDVVVDGDLVYWTVRFTGTNTGSFNGLPPTGRSVDVLAINKGVMRDGLAAEHWTGNDVMLMMSQLGFIPEPQPAG